ncbi:hypothetical protein [Roseivivax sp. CAU 1753]
MLSMGTGLARHVRTATRHAPPVGFVAGSVLSALTPQLNRGRVTTGIDPRSLVDAAIWSGPAFHVDGDAGDDGNGGLGSFDGDFADPVRSIYRAFELGNATGAAYRVVVKAGNYEESAFTKNGQREPSQPVAILGWGGAVHFRTGPHAVSWSDAGGTYTTPVSVVRRVFRQDIATEAGLAVELVKVADPGLCAATPDSWCDASGLVHVNIGQVPGAEDIILLRSFHGARFLTHAHDLYLEDIHCEGGITGTLHCDAAAARSIVGVRCSFRYAAPSNPAAPYDAVRIRRTSGLCAFFDCDASGGAKDGWSFHEDGNPGLEVLLQNCRGVGNGAGDATSCNGFTTHDAVVAAVLGGTFGYSRNGTEVHCIQNTRTWCLGTTAIARDGDGSSIAFKCSNAATMWLEKTRADAVGAGSAFGIEANGGTVLTRGHQARAGSVATSNGGTVSPF